MKKDVIKALNFVSKSQAKGDIRKFLNGVLLKKMSDSETHIVATDGHRLACYSLDYSIETGEQGAIIPREMIETILKAKVDEVNGLEFFALKKEPTKKSIGAVIVSLMEGVEIRSKLINSKYPEYLRVIPDEVDNFFSISRADFFEKLKYLKSFCDAENKGCYLDIGESQISLKVKNESFTKTALIDIEGNFIGQIGFNIDYLISMCESFSEEILKIYFYGSDHSILITAEDNPSKRFVLMPLRDN